MYVHVRITNMSRPPKWVEIVKKKKGKEKGNMEMKMNGNVYNQSISQSVKLIIGADQY